MAGSCDLAWQVVNLFICTITTKCEMPQKSLSNMASFLTCDILKLLIKDVKKKKPNKMYYIWLFIKCVFLEDK